MCDNISSIQSWLTDLGKMNISSLPVSSMIVHMYFIIYLLPKRDSGFRLREGGKEATFCDPFVSGPATPLRDIDDRRTPCPEKIILVAQFDGFTHGEPERGFKPSVSPARAYPYPFTDYHFTQDALFCFAPREYPREEATEGIKKPTGIIRNKVSFTEMSPLGTVIVMYMCSVLGARRWIHSSTELCFHLHSPSALLSFSYHPCK